MLRPSEAIVLITIVISAVVLRANALAQGGGRDFYSACALHPQGTDCATIYREALKDNKPGAIAVRQAFDQYFRYLKRPPSSLTEADRHYLRDNQIDLPAGLSPEDLGGVHNVIHDPALHSDPDAKRGAVNSFLGRALQAELYCDFNACTAPVTAQAQG